MRRLVCSLGLLTGCEQLLSIQDPKPGAGPGSDGAVDAADTDGGLPVGSPILLSEIAMTPNDGEMIEIVNTSNQPVDLSTYYLSDSGNYFKMPVDKTVDATDFIVKFPTGAMIAGHGVVTVALDTPVNFSTRYGVAPSYSMMDASMERIATNGTANLTNAGELVVLFQWDGRSDRVRDVDIVLAGAPVAGNALIDKSGMPQDGPDAGDAPTAYATDKNSIQGQAVAPGSGGEARCSPTAITSR